MKAKTKVKAKKPATKNVAKPAVRKPRAKKFHSLTLDPPRPNRFVRAWRALRGLDETGVLC